MTTALPGKDWLSRKEAAAYLTSIGYLMTPTQMERLAAKGKNGPPYRRFRARTIYNRGELELWARSQTVEVGPRPAVPQERQAPRRPVVGALAAART